MLDLNSPEKNIFELTSYHDSNDTLAKILKQIINLIITQLLNVGIFLHFGATQTQTENGVAE